MPAGWSKRSGWLEGAVSATTTSAPSRRPRLAASPVASARRTSSGCAAWKPKPAMAAWPRMANAATEAVALGHRVLVEQIAAHQRPHDPVGGADPQAGALGQFGQADRLRVAVEAAQQRHGALHRLSARTGPFGLGRLGGLAGHRRQYPRSRPRGPRHAPRLAR